MYMYFNEQTLEMFELAHVHVYMYLTIVHCIKEILLNHYYCIFSNMEVFKHHNISLVNIARPYTMYMYNNTIIIMSMFICHTYYYLDYFI